MQDANEDLNKTAVKLATKALISSRLEESDGKYVWISEVQNSTWTSKCTRLVLSIKEWTKLFQCQFEAHNLCYSQWDYVGFETT